MTCDGHCLLSGSGKSPYPINSWVMELVTPDSISCLCFNRLKRLLPLPLSSVPVDKVPSRLDFPDMVAPASETRNCGNEAWRTGVEVFSSVFASSFLTKWVSGCTYASATSSLDCRAAPFSSHSHCPTATIRTTST